MDDGQQHQRRGPGASTTPDDAASHVERLERELAEARHAQLLQRDHIVGIEAEVGRQNSQLLELHASLRRVSARVKRLDDRKRSQGKRIGILQDKLEAARTRNAALTRRVRELEAHASAPSLARRIVRRVRGSGR